MAQSKTTKELNVLQIVPQLKIGGVERGVIDLFRYLNQKKVKNYILCENFSDDLFSKTEINKIISCEPLRFKGLTNYFNLNKLLKKIIIKNKINLIHITSRAPAFIFYRLLKHNPEIKYISSFHNPYSGSFIKKYYNSFLLKGNSVICNSHFTKEFILNNFNIPYKKLIAIPRGIDLKYFNPKIFNQNNLNKIKYKLKILPEDITISIPSRFSKWKGHNQLIEFLNKQPSDLIKKLKIIFFIDNKNSKNNYIISISNDLLKKRIIFINLTKDIREIYAISDIIVSSSTKPEGFGRTISEALAMNCIPIGVNHGGVKEQLEGFDKKLLFNINDQKSFNSSLKYALNVLRTKKFNGRYYVKKKYSLEMMLKSTLDVYVNDK